MSRNFRILAAACGFFLPAVAPAEDAAGWIEELRELRKVVETQNKKIDALTAQVSRLSAALDGKPAAEPPPADPPPAAAAKPATPAQEEFSTAAAPKAEPATPQHVVMKGETLTSIAKHYNLSLADLMKANKGLNERKLQIGQTINLPSPPKNPETKANP